MNSLILNYNNNEWGNNSNNNNEWGNNNNNDDNGWQ